MYAHMRVCVCAMYIILMQRMTRVLLLYGIKRATVSTYQLRYLTQCTRSPALLMMRILVLSVRFFYWVVFNCHTFLRQYLLCDYFTLYVYVCVRVLCFCINRTIVMLT